MAIIDAIERSKTSKPYEKPQTSGEKVGALLVSMISRFDAEKKDTVLMLCIEQCSDLKEHEILLHLLRYYLEQTENKICDDLSLALKDPEILGRFIE